MALLPALVAPALVFVLLALDEFPGSTVVSGNGDFEGPLVKDLPIHDLDLHPSMDMNLQGRQSHDQVKARLAMMSIAQATTRQIERLVHKEVVV